MTSGFDPGLLLEEARRARAHGYAPYSGFQVGAAILTEAGQIVCGANVENASYGLAMCAERVALAKAVSEGIRAFRAIAVIGPGDEDPCAPCGSCRQVLHEFAPDILVITAGGPGRPPRETALRDLLPMPFTSSRLSAASEHGRVRR